MKITTLRKMLYENTFIYVMQFDYVFQYLFSWGNEVYEGHVEMLPSWVTRVKYRLGIINSPYDMSAMEEGEKIALSGAIDSIEKIISQGGKTRQFEKKKNKQIADIQDDIRARSTQACLWRAVDTKQGFYYECLTHGMIVKMRDGEKPQHAIISPIQQEEVTV